MAIELLRRSALGLRESAPKQSMCDSKTTKSQLIEELAALRRRVAVLEAEPLHESEERYRAMTDASPVGMFLIDAQGKNLYSNHAWCQITGYTINDALGDSWSKVIHPKDRDRVFPEWEAHLANHTAFDHELRCLCKEGKVIWVRVQISPIRDGTSLVGHVGVIEDITGRKRAEDAVRHSEQMFHQIAENIHEVFFVVDHRDYQVLYVNPAYETVWGRTRESLYENPNSWVDAVHPEDRERVLAALAK